MVRSSKGWTTEAPCQSCRTWRASVVEREFILPSRQETVLVGGLESSLGSEQKRPSRPCPRTCSLIVCLSSGNASSVKPGLTNRSDDHRPESHHMTAVSWVVLTSVSRRLRRSKTMSADERLWIAAGLSQPIEDVIGFTDPRRRGAVALVFPLGCPAFCLGVPVADPPATCCWPISLTMRKGKGGTGRSRKEKSTIGNRLGMGCEPEGNPGCYLSRTELRRWFPARRRGNMDNEEKRLRENGGWDLGRRRVRARWTCGGTIGDESGLGQP